MEFRLIALAFNLHKMWDARDSFQEHWRR